MKTQHKKTSGDLSSPKTNQDYNNKKPVPGDPQFKVKKQEPGKKINGDLLDDESLDPGDADGNGNLINKDGQDIFDERPVTDISDKNGPKPAKNIKNRDAREL